MAKFEPMWDTFLRGGGSFEPFMELYLERWLHSYVYFLPVSVRRVLIVVTQGSAGHPRDYDASNQGKDSGDHRRSWVTEDCTGEDWLGCVWRRRFHRPATRW